MVWASQNNFPHFRPKIKQSLTMTAQLICPFLLVKGFPQLGSEQWSFPVSCCQCFLVTISSVTTAASAPLLPINGSPFRSKGSLFPNLWFNATTGGKLFALSIRFLNHDFTVSFWTSSTSRCKSSKCRFSWRRVIMFSLQIGQDRVIDSRSSSAPERESWSRDVEPPESVIRGPGESLRSLVDEWTGRIISPPNTRRGREAVAGVVVAISRFSPASSFHCKSPAVEWDSYDDEHLVL